MFYRGRDFATFSLKKSKCRIKNRLGAPFFAYEFAWGRILNMYAVISPDKQNNDRMVSNSFMVVTKQKIYESKKNSLTPFDHYSVYHSYPFFVNAIFSRKKTTWSDRLRLLLQSFLRLHCFYITITMDISYI